MASFAVAAYGSASIGAGVGAVPLGALAGALLPRPAPRRSVASRRASHRFGEDAERAVSRFLHAGGYAILARRVRQRSGEIDLVVLRDDVVGFVEVKARSNGWDGLASVGRTKQGRLSRARDEWLADHPQYAGCSSRFDIALVWPGGRVEYLENAFEGVETDEFRF